jgi:hypothetical protein
MIESHRDRVKTSTAVHTRGELELAHPRDERLAMRVTLNSTDVAHLVVVSRVAAAALAPPWPSSAATVKLVTGLNIPHRVQRREASGPPTAIASDDEQTF